MQTNTLEETELTEPTNEPQPETPETPAPQPEPETTALIPAEPDVIEGEVIEIAPPETSENHPPPKQKPYWLLIPLTILFCLIFVAVSFLLPLLTPTATITIIPVERNITLITAIQVHVRQLPTLTLMQSAEVPATGKRHQSARHARGTITFYNGSFTTQTIAAGTTLTGNDRVQIITDQAVIIPAGNPPVYGQVTVSAYASIPGSQGNIPAYDIDTACCANSVLAKNTGAFTGGAAARDFLVITREDIQNVTLPLKATISQSENAALQAQLHAGEELITPTCNPHVLSDHNPGDEAKQVTVTVSETCTGIAYVAHTLHLYATQLLTTEVINRFGIGYSPLGDIQVSVLQAKITDHPRGMATLIVKIEATSVYHITPGERKRIIRLIAGKTPQQARAILLQVPGIAGAAITMNGNAATLPDDPGKIMIMVVSRL